MSSAPFYFVPTRVEDLRHVSVPLHTVGRSTMLVSLGRFCFRSKNERKTYRYRPRAVALCVAPLHCNSASALFELVRLCTASVQRVKSSGNFSSF